MSDMSGSFVDASWRERDRRYSRMMLARFADGKLAGQDVIIRNISKRGLGAATQGSLPQVGDSLSIKLPTGPTISGVVRWADGPTFGLALDVEMDPNSLADVEKRLRTPAASPEWEISRMHRVAVPQLIPSKLRRV